MNKPNPKFFILQWHITEKCNLRCKHCYQDPKLLKQEVNIEKLFKILDDFILQIKRWRIVRESVRVSITGGEPLIRRDFFDFLKKFYENKSLFQYGILTNGTFLDKKNKRKLEDLGLDYAQISLEGMEKVNDSIRGKGVFKKAIKAMELLKKTSIKANFSMTITRANLKEVPEVINLSKELKVPLSIRRCIFCGSGKQMKDFALEPKEIRSLWHYILKIRQNFWQSVSFGCEGGMLVQDFPLIQIKNCLVERNILTIMPNADVYPCRRLPILSGNLLKQSFNDIYYNSKVLKELRDRNNINNSCRQCPWYGKCRGGAKCMAFTYFKDFSAPDPHCWRLFDGLPNSS